MEMMRHHDNMFRMYWRVQFCCQLLLDSPRFFGNSTVGPSTDMVSEIEIVGNSASSHYLTGVWKVDTKGPLTRKETICLATLLDYHSMTGRFKMDLPCVKDLKVKMTRVQSTSPLSITLPFTVTESSGLVNLLHSGRLSRDESRCALNVLKFHRYFAAFKKPQPCEKMLAAKLSEWHPTASPSPSPSTVPISTPLGISTFTGLVKLLHSRGLSRKERYCIRSVLQFNPFNHFHMKEPQCLKDLSAKLSKYQATPTSALTNAPTTTAPFSLSQVSGLLEKLRSRHLSRQERFCLHSLIKSYPFHGRFRQELCMNELMAKLLPGHHSTTMDTTSTDIPLTTSQNTGD